MMSIVQTLSAAVSGMFKFPMRMTPKHEKDKKTWPYACHLCVRRFSTDHIPAAHLVPFGQIQGKWI